MAAYLNLIRLNHPLFGDSLSVKRVPQFLRFTVRGLASCSRSWDALDQLDDRPEPGEQVMVAKLAGVSTVHLDRTVKGRRVGEWHKYADYELVDPQPPDEVLRDTEKWREWVTNQLKGSGSDG